ncbi:acyl-CoA thioesterase [Melittangium boletus]|uniref:4-hydroxybenzoyl-CoA thioesterase family active site protein n=1 Tax=Melittangium boletus DSM 14713 TaxID=1294270 RepID=A0A250IRM6_9BACT|nr:thioesterase family protein [Melittangium boletus]ATB34405.1 4-hydroxybenzoyl-CoA thioesterase family active site protein [Melittangium boletus DSM 14713]
MVEARIRVIYGDTDQMGVVYHANYLRYFEFARGEFFRSRGGSYRELEREGVMLPVIEVAAAYKAPARYDDELVVRVWVSDFKRASLSFSYEVRRAGAPESLLSTGRTVHACVGRDGKPTRLPEALVRLLQEAT